MVVWLLLAQMARWQWCAAGFWVSPYSSKPLDAKMQGNVYLKGSADISIIGMDKQDLLGIIGFEFSLVKVEAQLLYNYASTPHVSLCGSSTPFSCNPPMCAMTCHA